MTENLGGAPLRELDWREISSRMLIRATHVEYGEINPEEHRREGDVSYLTSRQVVLDRGLEKTLVETHYFNF